MAFSESSSLLPNLCPGVSKPLAGAKLRILLNGLGVQSVTMFLMAERGLIGPKPDYSFTSDTGDESTGAMENLALLRSPNMGATIPIIMSEPGGLADDFDLATAGFVDRFSNPPLFIRNDDGTRGILARGCTRDYKVRPGNRQVRKLLGLGPHSRLPTTPVVEQWLGITTDESHRMAINPQPHIYNRHPLVEIGFSYADCENWLQREYELRVPSSGCKRCPFRDNAEWLSMQRNYPEDFEVACQADEAARDGMPGVRQPAYLHDSLRPLRSIDFEAEVAARRGGLFDPKVNLCSGECRT